MAKTAQPSRGVSKPKSARARGAVQQPVSAAARARGPQSDPAAEEDEVDVVYPKVKYRKAPVTTKNPHGWECKKVYDEADESRLGKEWADSPDDV